MPPPGGRGAAAAGGGRSKRGIPLPPAAAYPAGAAWGPPNSSRPPPPFAPVRAPPPRGDKQLSGCRFRPSAKNAAFGTGGTGWSPAKGGGGAQGLARPPPPPRGRGEQPTAPRERSGCSTRSGPRVRDTRGGGTRVCTGVQTPPGTVGGRVGARSPRARGWDTGGVLSPAGTGLGGGGPPLPQPPSREPRAAWELARASEGRGEGGCKFGEGGGLVLHPAPPPPSPPPPPIPRAPQPAAPLPAAPPHAQGGDIFLAEGDIGGAEL